MIGNEDFLAASLCSPASSCLAHPDGFAALANGINNNVVGILLGTGTGSFGPSRQVELGASNPLGITAADINGDGQIDLAVTLLSSATSNGLGLVSVLLGRGDGTFAAPALYLTGVFPSSVAVGDLNGDRIPDLAVANVHGNSISIFRGNSSGALKLLEKVQVNGYPQDVKLVDVNGDGKLDLVLPSRVTNNLSILLNRF